VELIDQVAERIGGHRQIPGPRRHLLDLGARLLGRGRYLLCHDGRAGSAVRDRGDGAVDLGREAGHRLGGVRATLDEVSHRAHPLDRCPSSGRRSFGRLGNLADLGVRPLV
jgi:hypothetical protein